MKFLAVTCLSILGVAGDAMAAIVTPSASAPTTNPVGAVILGLVLLALAITAVKKSKVSA